MQAVIKLRNLKKTLSLLISRIRTVLLLSLKLWNYKHALILCMPVNYKAVKCSFFVELMTFYYRMRWSIVLFNLNWTKYYRNLITNWHKGNNISVYRELFNLIAVRCCSPLPNNSSGNHFLGKRRVRERKEMTGFEYGKRKINYKIKREIFWKITNITVVL